MSEWKREGDRKEEGIGIGDWNWRFPREIGAEVWSKKRGGTERIATRGRMDIIKPGDSGRASINFLRRAFSPVLKVSPDESWDEFGSTVDTPRLDEGPLGPESDHLPVACDTS